MVVYNKVLFLSYRSNISTPKEISYHLISSVKLGELGATFSLLRDWLVHINIFGVD